MRLALPTMVIAALLVFSAGHARAQSSTEREVSALAARAEEMAGADRWSEALELYRQARERTRDADTRRDLQLNIGVCLMGLGRYLDAVASFEAFANEGGDAGSVRDLLGQARGSLATLELTVQPANATVLVDGAPREGSGATRRILVDPGEHRVEVRADGHESRSEVVASRSGASSSARIALDPSPAITAATGGASTTPTDGGGDDTVLWIILGVSAAAIGVGVGLGVHFGTQPQIDTGTTGIVFTGLQARY